MIDSHLLGQGGPEIKAENSAHWSQMAQTGQKCEKVTYSGLNPLNGDKWYFPWLYQIDLIPADPERPKDQTQFYDQWPKMHFFGQKMVQKCPYCHVSAVLAGYVGGVSIFLQGISGHWS